MYPRQIAIVLVAFILILAAALFVVTRDGGDDTTAATSTTTTTEAAATTTSAAAETTTTTTTTTIPTECSVDAAGTTSTTTEPPDNDQPFPTVPDGSTLNEFSTISTVGLDEVDFGMTVIQAEEATNTRMIACSPPSECYRVTPADAPDGISFVVTAGTIERVDIVGGPITTRSGVGVGTTQERVMELFGEQIETSVNPDSSVDLIFVPLDEGDDQFRVIFTIRDGVVDTYRSGRVPMVLDLDPCAA